MATAPNPQQEEQDPAARRMSLRRARSGGSMGFSPSTSTSTETLDAEDAPDEDLQDRVRRDMPRLAPPAPAPDDPDENRRRLAEAAMAGDQAYARDFRLGLLHRLLMRGISLDNIARELGVSLSTIKQDRAELKRRLRETARGLDVNELIGGQMAFYDEATAMSLRISSQQGMPTGMRLAGIRTALAAKADQTRFLTSAGVFDVLSFRRQEDGSDLSDVQVLMQRTEEMLQRLSDESNDAAPAPGDEPPPRPRIVRRRAGGFSFDDRNASSSSDPEVVEL